MASLSPAHIAHLKLALIPGLGPRLTATLLRQFGSAESACNARESELRQIPQIGEKLADAFARAMQTLDPADEIALLERYGVRPVIKGEDGYPSALAALPDSPALLYIHGDGWQPGDANAVALVGSRHCTGYGRKMAAEIAAGLCRAGIAVVSGLARGIDGAAHRGALDAGGRTHAVLAGGLSKIYPPEHAELADEVAARGALISETPMTVAPQPGMFPARNRIISGMSRAVVIVEANAKSGALITAEHALEQGREVFAVPGNVDSAASAGCLELIRKGAKLVRSAEDVLEDLRGLSLPVEPPGGVKRKPAAEPARVDPPPPPPVLEPEHQRVWDALATVRHGDDLARELGLPVSELAKLLMKMEMKRLIRRLPGNQYERR